MQPAPLVSTIIPTYNRAMTVCNAIESVLAQTYRNVEVIVVDDGSTDDTRQRIEKYGSLVKVLYQQNGGASAARNKGIGAAHGEIITFLDSDDLWMPRKLERQVRCLDLAGPDVVCCLCNAILQFFDGITTTSFDYALLFPQEDEGIWTNVPEVLITRFVMFNQMIAVRRHVLERTGMFDENLRHGHDDTDLALRLSLEGPWAFVREPLAMWRQGNDKGVSFQAESDPIRSNSDVLRVRAGILNRLNETSRHTKLRELLNREIARTKKEMAVTRINQEGRARSSLYSGAMRLIHRYQHAIDRRLRYPKMQTKPLKADQALLVH